MIEAENVSLSKRLRKPRFERSNMAITVRNCKLLYDEVIQWRRWDESDTSMLATVIYGMAFSGVYLDLKGNISEREQVAINAVTNAVEYLQNVLEDVLGIQSEDYVDNLKNDECGRFRLVDTVKEKT